MIIEVSSNLDDSMILSLPQRVTDSSSENLNVLPKNAASVREEDTARK